MKSSPSTIINTIIINIQMVEISVVSDFRRDILLFFLSVLFSCLVTTPERAFECPPSPLKPINVKLPQKIVRLDTKEDMIR